MFLAEKDQVRQRIAQVNNRVSSRHPNRFFNIVLVTTASGTPKIGTVTSICYFLSLTNNYCTTTLSFGYFGDMTFMGPFTDDTGAAFVNAIVGGTGIFAGAGGSVRVDVLVGGQVWKYTIGLKAKANGSGSGSATTWLALAALMLLSASPVFGWEDHKPPKPPKEICDKTIVVTEKFNETAWVTPTGIPPGSDLSPFIGYSLGYIDPLYLGASVEPKTRVGKASDFCYVFALKYSYCVNTLEFGIFGSITFLGPFTDVQDACFDNAIAGGTGIFSGAEGIVKVKVLKEGEVYAYKIELEDKPKCKDN
ncbi:allene oxide cyclase [Volvox carteri f. nagariensis]|uniref:Allene oxide cyclase n=1 Tax=Volvox carteri f. nagariensis TaxID=3068 RepID=D8UJ69_VOLCA|nr:allene oxide cyclase [Volvox carteri f. nagariensis]EFJ40233.1 allene oxide cyclase [Volvox carteri f. nagariensis]|eukprot:XP_002958713.1 allene oxide cyclase [Volvox carteri f. nagariensis]